MQRSVGILALLNEPIQIGRAVLVGRCVALEAGLVAFLQCLELLDLDVSERTHQGDVVRSRALVVHPPADQVRQLHLLHDRRQVGAVALGLGDVDEAAQLTCYAARVVDDDAVSPVQREQDEVAERGLFGLPGDW